MQHRTQNDLEKANFTSTGSMMKSPEGLVFGFGTTVGNGIEGWAPNALFVDTDASQGSGVFTNTGSITSATWTEIADAGVAAGFTLDDAANIVLGTSTGTKIGTSTSQKIGFYNTTPVVQASAPTSAVATITHTAPGTDDFAWADLTTSTPYGLANQDEARSVLKAIRINQLRIAEIETVLQNLGLMA